MRGLGKEGLRPHEALLLFRRRKNLTQAQAAELQGISKHKYSFWERGLDVSIPKIDLGKIYPHEFCLIYRRRVGMTQTQVAKELGCCKEWLKRMEQGKVDCKALLDFWEL